MAENPLWRWFDNTFLDLGRQFRWSYLPPLMVYLAAGVSGLTSIVGTFFIKEYLDLSAAFLAGLCFWAGIPWTLKMPIGHLVDLIWRRKALLVYLGASLLALSILIMYGVIAHTAAMAAVMKVEAWFVISTILAPTGYVLQDVVADAMTVEAVPTIDEHGEAYPERDIKIMHVTMQTLGRVAIIGGFVAVSLLNVTLFDGVEEMDEAAKIDVYANIYLLALIIPLISILGVILGGILLRRRARQMEAQGLDHSNIDKLLFAPAVETHPNWWILGGSLVFAIFTISMGVSEVPFAQEIIFAGSMSIILFLMYRLLLELERPGTQHADRHGHHYFRVPCSTPDRPRNGLVRNRCTRLRSTVPVGIDVDLIGADPGRYVRVATDDGKAFDRFCHRHSDPGRRPAVAAKHRAVLRRAGMDRRTYRRCG